MLLSSVQALVVRAGEIEGEREGIELGLPAWAIGLITLAILMALLAGVVSFGGGREHS